MRVVVIMAGGSGTRFWPASRKNRPKQFLDLTSDNPMLVETVKRAQEVPGVAPDGVYIVAGPHLADAIRDMLEPYIPGENVLVEPAGRNTAPCLALAALTLAQKGGPETAMGVFTADSLIRDWKGFGENADLAFAHAEAEDALVTFGARPAHPDTGFGYLEYGEKQREDKRGTVYAVRAFREKPDLETAREYVKAGNFYWNTGMFFWRCSTLLKSFERHCPEIGQSARKLLEEKADGDAINAAFMEWPQTSIDYAVMEKADNVCSVAGRFDWDDVGSWDALARVFPVDEAGNLFLGPHVDMDGKNLIVYNKDAERDADKPVVATLGLENLVIARTPDAVMICHRDRVQDIKKLLEKVKTEGHANKA